MMEQKHQEGYRNNVSRIDHGLSLHRLTNEDPTLQEEEYHRQYNHQQHAPSVQRSVTNDESDNDNDGPCMIREEHGMRWNAPFCGDCSGGGGPSPPLLQQRQQQASFASSDAIAADALQYLLRYESLVRQQDAEDMAIVRHIQPCLEKIQALAATTTTGQPQTMAASMKEEKDGYKNESSTSSPNESFLSQEISILGLRAALKAIEKGVDFGKQKALTTEQFLTTDRQLMMVLRLLTKQQIRTDIRGNQNGVFGYNNSDKKGSQKAKNAMISFGEILFCYKICCAGMSTLQHLPGSNTNGNNNISIRRRARNRILAILSLFEPIHSFDSLRNEDDDTLSLSPPSHFRSKAASAEAKQRIACRESQKGNSKHASNENKEHYQSISSTLLVVGLIALGILLGVAAMSISQPENYQDVHMRLRFLEHEQQRLFLLRDNDHDNNSKNKSKGDHLSPPGDTTTLEPPYSSVLHDVSVGGDSISSSSASKHEKEHVVLTKNRRVSINARSPIPHLHMPPTPVPLLPASSVIGSTSSSQENYVPPVTSKTITHQRKRIRILSVSTSVLGSLLCASQAEKAFRLMKAASLTVAATAASHWTVPMVTLFGIGSFFGFKQIYAIISKHVVMGANTKGSNENNNSR